MLSETCIVLPPKLFEHRTSPKRDEEEKIRVAEKRSCRCPHIKAFVYDDGLTNRAIARRHYEQVPVLARGVRTVRSEARTVMGVRIQAKPRDSSLGVIGTVLHVR